MMRLLIPSLLAALSGCNDGAGKVDDSGTPDGTDAALCADAPVLTWNNFGEGFVLENCQSCHASTSPDRNDAPETVTFDTLEEVQAHKERILARSTGSEPTMPPQGGVSDEDRQKLEIWLRCWESP